MPLPRQYQDIKVGLNEADRARLIERARIENRTQTEIAREGIRWYLDNVEKLVHQERDTEVAQAIRYATDQHVKAIKDGVERMCKMLARQGVALGTIYELTFMSLPDTEQAREIFDVAVTHAKQKMRRYVQKDEEELAQSMSEVLGAK